MRFIWIVPAFGVLMILLGSYVAGGTAVTCRRSPLAPAVGEAADGSRPALVAACTVETRRWRARRIVAERTYLRVTDVDSIAVSRTETSKDSRGRTFTRTVDDWSLRLFDRDTEIVRIGGTRAQIDRENQRLRDWLKAGGAEPVHASFSEWGFAYGAIGFGVVWITVTSMVAKLMTGANATRRWTRRELTLNRRPRRRARRSPEST